MSIAVIRFSALGDIASALPYIRALREGPTLITSGMGAGLLQDEFPDIHVLKSKRIRDVFSLVCELRKQRFDHLIDLQNNDRSRLLRSLTSARAKISSKGMPGGVPNLDNFHRIMMPSGLLQEPDTSFTPKPCDYIVLNVASSSKWHAKRLPVAKWQQFAALLHDRYGLPFKLTGGADERDYVAEVAAQLPGECENVAGQTSLVELKLLLRNAFLVVSTDSAAMQLAAAEKTPTIGLFGCTNWVRARPFGPWSTVLYDKAVYPDDQPPPVSIETPGAYYDGIDLADGLTALAKFL